MKEEGWTGWLVELGSGSLRNKVGCDGESRPEEGWVGKGGAGIKP